MTKLLICVENTLVIQIKIIGFPMNNSFQFVHNSLLNRSKSKETHLFPRAERFTKTRTSYCSQSAYDLTKTMLSSSVEVRKDSLSKDQRFKLTGPHTPSPNAYHHKSFVDIIQAQKKGNTFRKQQKFKNISKNHLFPGPAAYEAQYNPQKKLSYTMRNRNNVPDHRPKVGPGQYYVENYHAVSSTAQVSSKYSNPKTCVIGTAQRFNQKAHITPGPGPFSHSRIKTDYSGSLNPTFAKTPKQPSYIPKNKTPAPNYYNHFSEFSELKGGIRSQQNLSIGYQ